MAQAKDWGWVDDPGLLQTWRGMNRPPDGHPHRCHGAKRGSNPPQRCQKWAVSGYRYCISHAPNLYRVKEKGGVFKKRRAAMTYYTRRAGQALKERLQELAVIEPSRRHSLAEEVDLARIACDRAVQLFETTCLDEQSGASIESKAAALSVLRSALDHVADMVTKAAKARKDSLESVDVEQLDYIVSQVVVILQEEVAPLGNDVVDRCVERFKKINLPERRGAGGPDRATLAKMFRDSAQAIEESIPTSEAG